MCIPLCLLNAVLRSAQAVLTFALAKGFEIAAALVTSAILAGPVAAAGMTATSSAEAVAKAAAVQSIAADVEAAELMVQRSVERVAEVAPVARIAIPRTSRVIASCAGSVDPAACIGAATQLASSTAISLQRAASVRLSG